VVYLKQSLHFVKCKFVPSKVCNELLCAKIIGFNEEKNQLQCYEHSNASIVWDVGLLPSPKCELIFIMGLKVTITSSN
jgi:hypothetical protein